MAEEYDLKSPVKVEEGSTPVEATDRGLFGFGGRKEEEVAKPQEEVIVTEFEEKVQISEPESEHKHGSLLEKLHRSGSSSSSSSCEEEEVEEGGEKKKKKKIKDKIKDKISGDKKIEEEQAVPHEDTSIPVEKCDEPVAAYAEAEEKKGLLDKIKDKLPGGHKKPEEVAVVAPPPQSAAVECATPTDGEGKEKKGFIEKIKEKLPGYHKQEDEKEKEKEKEAASHY